MASKLIEKRAELAQKQKHLASIFEKKKDRMEDATNTLLPPLLVVLLFVTLTYFQNDYSTAGILLLMALALFFVAGVSILHLGAALHCGATAGRECGLRPSSDSKPKLDGQLAPPTWKVWTMFPSWVIGQF